MANAIRNKQPLQSETGGACSPSPPPGPRAAQKCSSTLSEPLLVSITADSSQLCTGCSTAGTSRRQDSLRCVSQHPLLTLAPAILKQQNQAGNSGSVFTGTTATDRAPTESPTGAAFTPQQGCLTSAQLSPETF